MLSHWTRRLGLPLFAAAIASCSDSGGLGTNLQDLVLDFCSGSDTPVFIALQNEGQNWTRITPDANGTINLRASNKVGLAFVYQTGASSYFTDVLYTTRDELGPLANSVCPEQTGTKILNGSVASVSGSATGEVTMSDAYALVTPPPSTFTLAGVASGPQDLVASRSDFVLGVFAPNRVIVRRSLNLTNGATIPALDFAANEALAPTPSNVTISGFSTNDNTTVQVDFSTATTPFHPLFQRSGVPSSTQTIYGIPSTLTQSGDVHILTIRALSSTGNSYRVSEQYYRDPSDKLVALGAALSAPAVTTISSTPNVRLSTSLPSQVDYGSFANVTHSQTGRVVSVTGTAAYFGGTPTNWLLDVPDLSGVSGFSSTNFGLQPGAGSTTYAEAYSGTLATFFGAFVDGGALKFAGRISGVGLAEMTTVGAEGAVRAPRRSHFSVRGR